MSDTWHRPDKATNAYKNDTNTMSHTQPRSIPNLKKQRTYIKNIKNDTKIMSEPNPDQIRT